MNSILRCETKVYFKDMMSPNTRQSNYMQTGKVEYKPVNIEDLTIVRTQCIPLIKSTQILSGDIC